MDRSGALDLIRRALDASGAATDGSITEDTDLIGEGIVDSLDAMVFLFELEKSAGSKLTAIDEDYEDFRVGALIDAVLHESD